VHSPNGTDEARHLTLAPADGGSAADGTAPGLPEVRDNGEGVPPVPPLPLSDSAMRLGQNRKSER
jgi:hypothetical protein